MKKVYLLLTVILLGGLYVNAQSFRPITPNYSKKQASVNHNIATRHSAPTHVNHLASSSVIWSNDFDNAADWNLTSSVGTGTWVIGSAPPNGSYPIGPITSVSGGDYALYDSDAFCDSTTGQIADLTTVTAIDLTGHANVRLTFNEWYERFHDSTYVYVSTNNTTWTRFEVNAGLQTNFFPGESTVNTPGLNPWPVSVDISSVAGNQATDYI